MSLKLNLILFILCCPVLTLAQEFTGSFDLISTQAYKNGNVRHDSIAYFIDKDQSAIKIKGKRNQPDVRMIFNFKQETITNTFILNGKKSGYILPMDKEHWPGLPEARRDGSSGNEGTYELSGEEKEFQGYTCKLVNAENSEYKALLWIADEIPLSMAQVLSYQSVGKGKSRKELDLFNEFGIDKLPIKMQLFSKTGKADVTIELINIKETVDRSVFSTDGYNLSRME